MTSSIGIVHDLLVSDAAVSALLADRVFPLVRPSTFITPAVTLQRIIATPQNHLSGDSGLQYDRVQLDTWALTYASTQQVANACRKAINAGGFIMERELDMFIDSAELSGIYRIVQEYSIWFNP